MTNKTLGQIAIGILVLLAIGVSIALYTGAWNPAWNPFSLSAEKVFAQSLEKMAALKTARMDWRINMVIKGEKASEEATLSFKVKSDYDLTLPENPKTKSDLEMLFSTEGMQFLWEMGAVSLGEESYLIVKTLPAFPLLDMVFEQFGINLKEIKGKWIKIDEDSLKEAFEMSIVFVPEDEKAEALAEFELMQAKQKEMQAAFEDLFKKSQKKIFSVKEELPAEKIGGQAMHHYILLVKKEELKELFTETVKILNSSFDSPSFNESELKQAEEGIREFLDKIGDLEADVWIGKKDLFFHRIKMEKEIKESFFETGGGASVVFGLEINYSNFNQPVAIAAPAESLSFKEAIEILVPGLFDPSYQDFYQQMMLPDTNDFMLMDDF